MNRYRGKLESGSVFFMSKKSLGKIFGEILWSGKKCYFGLPISVTRYILTPSKLYFRTGLLSINEEQIELYRVVDFSLKLPFVQRIFGCGTIKMYAKDRTNSYSELKAIRNPREALRLIEENVQKEREKYRVHGRDMIGSYADDADADSY